MIRIVEMTVENKKDINIANQPKGLEIGARHISISTCGLVPKINQFALENLQSNLAISLHATTNEIRDQIMPVNKAYPLEVLIPALKDYIAKTNRRVTLEYILLREITMGYGPISITLPMADTLGQCHRCL